MKDIFIYNFGKELPAQAETFLAATLEQYTGEPCRTSIMHVLPHEHPTIGTMLESVGLRGETYTPFYVLLPADPVLAAGIVAEMYRRARRFPILLRISQGNAQSIKIELIDPTPRRAA